MIQTEENRNPVLMALLPQISKGLRALFDARISRNKNLETEFLPRKEGCVFKIPKARRLWCIRNYHVCDINRNIKHPVCAKCSSKC
jgi:hypothetical protein